MQAEPAKKTSINRLMSASLASYVSYFLTLLHSHKGRWPGVLTTPEGIPTMAARQRKYEMFFVYLISEWPPQKPCEMKETHIRSSVSATVPQCHSATCYALSWIFSWSISPIFIISIGVICIVYANKSSNYNFHPQTTISCRKKVCGWLTSLKFEIFNIVFRLRRGNLPVRINEVLPSFALFEGTRDKAKRDL